MYVTVYVCVYKIDLRYSIDKSIPIPKSSLPSHVICSFCSPQHWVWIDLSAEKPGMITSPLPLSFLAGWVCRTPVYRYTWWWRDVVLGYLFSIKPVYIKLHTTKINKTCVFSFGGPICGFNGVRPRQMHDKWSLMGTCPMALAFLAEG